MGGGFSSFRAMSRPAIRPGPFSGRSAPWRGPVSTRRRFGFARPYFGYYSYPFVPYGGYSSFYPSYWGSPDDYSGDEAAAYPEQEDPLVSQVEQLSDEVESLREGQQGPRQYPPVAASTSTERFLPTVFVYRDGHHFEAQDYALLGQTLWVFGDGTARKIPVADLDLETSKKLNDARGVDFPLPASR